MIPYGRKPFHNVHCPKCGTSPYRLQALPDGLIYKPYLAGPKESRLSGSVFHSHDGGSFYDATLGGRLGLLRFGTQDPIRPQGFQLDAEGSAQVRLDIPDDIDVRSVDFRGGLFTTWGDRYHQTRFGYYHISSHLGDEFLIKYPEFDRVNYSRDVLVLGHTIYFCENLRSYAELGWAFATEISDPFEFQMGLDYAPNYATGIHGAPFLAINGHLREEINYSGGFNMQAGWAWRSQNNGGLFRIGFHYFNGKSSQYSFFNEHEQYYGFGIWHDR